MKHAYAILFVILAAAPTAAQPAVPQPTPIIEVPAATPQSPAPSVPTVPAVVTTTVPSPASPQNVGDQVMWALAMSYLLRYLMQKRWLAFLTPDTSKRIKTLVGFIVATGTAAGINLAVNGSFFSPDGVSIGITGLSFDAFKAVGFQWVSQQTWYTVVVKRMDEGGAL